MMLVLLLCVIMKIAELSVGRVSPSLSLSSRQPPPYYYNNSKRRFKEIQHWNNINNKFKYYNKKRIGKGAMMEDPQTPGSDCNSNPADPISQDLISSEFIQDNSDYQWFIDYGYRDGGLHVHPSVLSSLSTSYTQEDLGYYDDLARNLDANLAEVDMESFRTADIHTLLTALPVMCTDPVQQSEFNYQRERYASISGSVMEKIEIGSSISPHTSSQGEDSACSTTDTISICKSSLLFSPVKETPVLPPGGSYSVDSLDCEDMLLTCQANNKNNYTIAFEGSMTMYSDGSQDFESQDKQKTFEPRENYYNRKMDLKNMLDYSMACSDSKVYTTWSNLKHLSNKTITRHGSGNNNTIPNFLQAATANAAVLLNPTKRSMSLPDLSKTRENYEHINIPLNFSMDSAESHHQHLHSSESAMSRSVNDSSNSNASSSGKKIQNMSLLKLFMKQKSMSAEGMSLTLDQSESTSDNGWPNSNSSSAASGTNTNTQIHRNINETCSKKYIPDNDFAINWVKTTDCYKSTGNGSSNDDSSNTSKRIPSIKEFKEESPSVEELSESILKSDVAYDKHEVEQLVGGSDFINNKNIQRKSWNKTSSEQEAVPICKTTGTQATTEVEENGVQTSLLYSLTPKNNYPWLRETYVDKKPVYVVYPNYALPDLSFLNVKDTRLDNIALKPQERVSTKKTGRSNRPFSCNDLDALKQRGFSHVKDWESLTFLLPTEYRKILYDVPEIPRHIKLTEETKKPLFCLSPPMSRHHRTRTISEIVSTNVSSSSSTGTQPSSGYRGSSTILTDSSSNQAYGNNNTTNPLYLYRYDSGSSENSLISYDKKSVRTTAGNQARVSHTGFSKRSISLPQATDRDCNDPNKVPPRPPLPRSILRKNRAVNKRYSMFEMGGVEEVEDHSTSGEPNKRMSLQEPYYINNDLQLLRHGRIIDSDKDVDEVEERRYAERMREAAVNNGLSDNPTDLESSGDDVKQLEEYLKRSGFSSSSDDGSDADVKLRSYVRKFLALRMNKDLKGAEMLESQKKTVSFAVNKRKPYIEVNNRISQEDINDHQLEESDNKPVNLEDKQKMINSVNKAVDLLMKYWNTQVDPRGQDFSDKNECAQICLSNLCPALYAIMSDGLRPHLNSTFGPLSNSVWHVVEASSQQGPLTNTLNELVQKINSEDFMTEGMLKFHAFVFGLLNLRALDAWFAYLCTRETILRKHYNSSSLFIAALGCAQSRKIIDYFLSILDPLAFCPFQLDLLYQYRQLHNSFSHVNSLRPSSSPSDSKDPPQHHYMIDKNHTSIPSPKRVRPRSCGSFDDKRMSIKTDPNDTAAKKRWSNVAIGSKMFPVLDKLVSEDSEEYTDSLEHSPLNRARKNITRISSPDVRNNNSNNHIINDADDNGDSVVMGDLKFKKLQEKWELMANKEESKEPVTTPSSPNKATTNVTKSKIPRLLTSPIKQPANTLGGVGKIKSPVTGIPSLKKLPPSTGSGVAGNKVGVNKKTGDLKSKDVCKRTSRVDQDHNNVTPRTHLTRPSSLPYKSHGITAKEKNLVSPQRRAVSTSLPRPNTPAASKANIQLKRPPKEVRTLTHRLPSDNGHLSFNEGDRLKVILEVDNKWLLCAKGDRKGLVPRSCVHICQT